MGRMVRYQRFLSEESIFFRVIDNVTMIFTYAQLETIIGHILVFDGNNLYRILGLTVSVFLFFFIDRIKTISLHVANHKSVMEARDTIEKYLPRGKGTTL